MSAFYRFFTLSAMVVVIFGPVFAQESATIQATANVVNPDIVKATASAEEFNISNEPYSSVVIMKPGNGNLQMNITDTAGQLIIRRLESKNGALYHRELLQSGKTNRPEFSLIDNSDSLTIVTFIYTDI